MKIDNTQRLYRVTEQRDRGILVTTYLVAADTDAIEKYYKEELGTLKLINVRSMGTANVLTE